MSELPLLHIYIVAGEASGDLLGAHLMRSLKAKSERPIKFHGIGGERMQQEGLTSLFPYHDLSLFGFAEIIPQLLKITARINQTADDILAKQPDVVITIDVPGFCLRVIEKVREHDTRAVFVHYVAPTVWAYNAWRAEHCATLFDHMLVLLPFEPAYFEKAGLAATFVGHPVVTETENGDGTAFRKNHGIGDNTTLLTLLPGSRKGEIARHMPILGRAVSMLASRIPDIALAVAVPKQMLEHVAPYFAGCPYRAVITADEQDKKDAISAGNLAIVKSGTVTLEVAKAGTPMIVTYRLNPLSAWLLKRKLTVKFVTLINILLDREVIPELLQERCTPMLIAAAAEQLLNHPDRQQAQKNAVAGALKQLFPPPGATSSDLAATTILKILPPLS